MKRDEGKRIKKYTKKIDGEVIKRRAEELRREMERKQKEHFEKAVKIENEVKKILEGESTLNIIYYIIFAKELEKLKEKYGGETLMKEVEILGNKWEKRGLDVLKLEQIKTYYIPSYKKQILNIFTLDESELDGNDVLG